MFSDVYDRESVVVTDRNASSNQRLKMKKDLVHHNIFVPGKDFDVTLLCKAKISTQTLISGRTLRSQALLVHKNVKKAMAYAREFCVQDIGQSNTGNLGEPELFKRMLALPSGSTREDVLKYVLDYVHWNFLFMHQY